MSNVVEEEPGGAAVQNGRASKTGARPKSRANKSASPAARLDQRRKTLTSSTGLRESSKTGARSIRRQSIGQTRLNVTTGREQPSSPHKSKNSSKKPKKEAKRTKSRQSTKSARTENEEELECSEADSDSIDERSVREGSAEEEETDASDLKSARSTKRD